MCPKPLREQAWQRLGELMDSERLNKLSRVIPLSEAREGAQALLEGNVQGRLIVDCR